MDVPSTLSDIDQIWLLSLDQICVTPAPPKSPDKPPPPTTNIFWEVPRCLTLGETIAEVSMLMKLNLAIFAHLVIFGTNKENSSLI